jgi:hypothetical protein
MAKPVLSPTHHFIRPFNRVFHYGQAIFEGMKAYKDDDDVWLLDLMKIIKDSIIQQVSNARGS